MRRTSSLLACALALGACQPDEQPATFDSPTDRFAGVDRPNVLLVLLDDAGVDKVSSYGMHPDAPPTPHIDALAAEGQRFTQAWAYPVCSPTRAALLTGQHVRRYGIGSRLLPNEDALELKAADTLSLAEMVAEVGYDTSFVGKRHLSSGRLGEAGYDHPTAHGFAWSEGSLANLVASMGEPENDRGYTYWEELRSGCATWRTRYATDGASWTPVLDAPTAPGSEQLFVEHFTPIGPGPYDVERMAARDAQFKYVLRETGEEELRRVGPDDLPDGPDILAGGASLTAEEEEAWERLAAFVQSERDRLRP